MDDNKNMSINGQSCDSNGDTIVFRRQPSPKTPPASDMQNTAKLQGGVKGTTGTVELYVGNAFVDSRTYSK